MYEKIRYDNRVLNMAVDVVIGIDIEGKRDILAIVLMQEESEATYKSLFDTSGFMGYAHIIQTSI